MHKLRHSKAFRLTAVLLFFVSSAQACASGAGVSRAPAPSSAAGQGQAAGQTGGQVECTTPEYQDLKRRAEEVPLSAAERKRMEELYADCVARSRAADQPAVKKSSFAGGFFKLLLVMGVIVGAGLFAAQQADEGG
ncbi:MAG: hypothetical protein ACE5GJ_06785 [Gemmatimonadota bacterium]